VFPMGSNFSGTGQTSRISKRLYHSEVITVFAICVEGIGVLKLPQRMSRPSASGKRVSIFLLACSLINAGRI